MYIAPFIYIHMTLQIVQYFPTVKHARTHARAQYTQSTCTIHAQYTHSARTVHAHYTHACALARTHTFYDHWLEQ